MKDIKIKKYPEPKFELYEIYSNSSGSVIGEIYLTEEQAEILTKAFQHRGLERQDLAVLIKDKNHKNIKLTERF